MPKPAQVLPKPPQVVPKASQVVPKPPQATPGGAQTAPGQFVGQYLVSTFYKGFRMPGFDIMDMALTVGSKAASRPVLKFLDDILPDDLTLKADVINTILQRQRAHGLNSLLSDDKGKGK